jgi:small subunit ribosomal protein S17
MTEKKEEKKVEAVAATKEKPVAKAPVTKVKKAKKVEVKIEKPQKEVAYAIRGNIFEGKVISAKAQKTITVERVLTHYISKYERYKKVKSKLKAHVPNGMEVSEGDKVRIGETRKISKTKNFVLMEVIEGKK